MSLKKLAEGIILQSIEDLWNENYREDSMDFLKSKDFGLCAELAEMELSDQVELLNLVKKSTDSMQLRRMKNKERERRLSRNHRDGKERSETVPNYA